MNNNYTKNKKTKKMNNNYTKKKKMKKKKSFMITQYYPTRSTTTDARYVNRRNIRPNSNVSAIHPQISKSQYQPLSHALAQTYAKYSDALKYLPAPHISGQPQPPSNNPQYQTPLNDVGVSRNFHNNAYVNLPQNDLQSELSPKNPIGGSGKNAAKSTIKPLTGLIDTENGLTYYYEHGPNEVPFDKQRILFVVPGPSTTPLPHPQNFPMQNDLNVNIPENTSTADTQQGVPTNPVQQVQSTSYTQTRSQTVDIDTIRYYRKLNENLPTLSSRYPISTPLATLPEESPPTTPVLQVQSSISAKQSPNLNDARDDTNNRYEDSKSDDSGSNSDDDIMKSLRTDVTPGDIPTQYHADLTDDTNSKVTTHNPNPLKSRMPNLSDMSPSIKTPPFKSGVSKIPLNTLPIKKRRKPPLPVNPLKSKSSTTSHTTNTANRPIKPPVRAIQYLSVVRRKPPYHENKENIRISSIENNLENIKTLSETKCKRSPAVTIPTMDSPPRADVKLADYLVPVDKDTIRAELIEKFHEIQKSLDFSDSELNDYCLSVLGVVTKVFVHEPSSSPTKYESGGFQTLLTEQPSVQFEYCAPSEKNAVLVEREKEIKVLKDQNVRLKKK
eukprot:194755_1